jgi:hypothetical protein
MTITESPVMVTRKRSMNTHLKEALWTGEFPPIAEARATWAAHRVLWDFANLSPALMTPPTGNAKLAKTGSYGLSLAPARESGINVCTHSTPGCRKGCLATAGKGGLASAQYARLVKTRFLYEEPLAFASMWMHEVAALYKRMGPELWVRPNVLSEIRFEHLLPRMFRNAPAAQFYDYVKDWSRAFEHTHHNYTVALSVSENTTDAAIVNAASQGMNLAIVFRTGRHHELPREYLGLRVIDADKSDRWLVTHKGEGVVGGLRAKGRAIHDTSGFVRSDKGN